MTNKLAPRQQHGYSALLLILIIVVLAVVGIVGFRVFGTSESNVPVDTIFSNLQATSKQKFSGGVSVDKVGWPAENGIGMPLKVEGHTFRVSSENMPSLEFQSIEDGGVEVSPECVSVQADLRPKSCPDDSNLPAPEDMRPLIATEMKKDGFTKEKAYSYKDTEDNGGFTVTVEPYTSESRGCVYADRLDVRFSCYDRASIQQAANKLAPFVTQYEQQYHPTATVYYGPLLVKQNKAEIIVVDGNVRKVAFFYNKDNGPWHYVARTDDELGLSCKQLAANPDIRAAFRGQICQSNGGTIRLDSDQSAS